MKKYLIWFFEFLLITSIGLIPVFWTEKFYLLFVPILGVIFLKFLEYHNNRLEKLEQVRILLDFLYRILEYNPKFEVRCTFHRPLKRKYKQLLNYIPNNIGKNRVFKSDKGLVSKCIEKKRPVVESFNSAKEFREKMINEYNYTMSEMQERSPERRSYLCYPLIDSNSIVRGVVYFDAVKPNVFSTDDSNRENNLIDKVSRAIYDVYLN